MHTCLTTIPGGLAVGVGLARSGAIAPGTTTAHVSGAGSAAGTLSTAPVAGNPSFWLPVKFNGTS